jgi:hypothetical protein
MEQTPMATIVTVAPDTVQTGAEVDVKFTVSPELAVAEIKNGAAPNATLGTAPNVIIWLP